MDQLQAGIKIKYHDLFAASWKKYRAIRIYAHTFMFYYSSMIFYKH